MSGDRRIAGGTETWGAAKGSGFVLGMTASVLALAAGACGGGGGSGGSGGGDASQDVAVLDSTAQDGEPGDGSADATALDAPGTDGSTAHDAAMEATEPEAGADASIDAPGADASLDGGSPTDGAAADGADAADASTGIPCSSIPNVGSIYYSRYPVPLGDGGTKTNGELWVMSGDGSSDVKLADGSHPRLSPDGKSLMYMRDTAPYYLGHLYVRTLPVDGGAPVDTLVVANNNGVIGYDWRPDSSGIVFDNGKDIWSANPDGTSTQVLTTYRESDGYSDAPQISRVDGRVAFHNFWEGLDLAASDGAGAGHIPNTFGGSTYPSGPIGVEADMYPVWTPDGQWLVFLKVPPLDAYTPGSMGPVWKIKPDGSGLVLVFNFDPGDGFLGGSGAISPDGTYYVGAGIYQGVQSIYAVPLDGSGGILRACMSPGPVPDAVGSVTAH